MSMRIQYLGTGAAEGVPAIFCNCNVCKTARLRGGREIRTRSQVWIDGCISMDFPPDAYMHSVRFGLDFSAMKHLFVTHSHMDHFYAHDFILRGYKYAHGMTEPTLHIWCNAEVAKVFAECTAREMTPQVGKGIELHVLKAYEPVCMDGYFVTPLPARHDCKEDCFVYHIRKGNANILYLNDTGRLYPEVYEYLKRVGAKFDLVSFDCTLGKETRGENARHMGIGDNMAVKAALEQCGVVDSSTRYVITHFSHNSGLLQETLAEMEKEYGVTAAYDGLEIRLHSEYKEENNEILP